jgi:hypothetical protein
MSHRSVTKSELRWVTHRKAEGLLNWNARQ